MSVAQQLEHIDGLALRVAEVLRTARLPVDTETALQADVARLLLGAGIPHVAEFKIGGGRIDFIVGYDGRFGSRAPCVGIECKIKGGARSILRQCDGYCGDPRIGHLIVLTAKALALPQILRGKPVTIVSVGRAWL